MATLAGGVVLSPQPARAAIPCESVVGTSSESAVVAVLGHSVYYAPLLLNTSPPPQNVIQGPEEVARSRDGGATWTGLSSGGPTTGGETPPWMSIDPHTGRLWYATAISAPSNPAEYCGARISWSDNGGGTWRTNPLVGCPAGGAEKIIEGPAPAHGARPAGYPHVVYYCANENDFAPQQPVYCYKSLDGGRTFSFTGANPDPAPPASCTTFGHRARTGVVGPDGVLYFPTSLCGSLGVTISTDEGASWHNIPMGITGITDTLYVESLAVDSAGNLYFSYLGSNGLPQLVISRDHARTWSSPVTVTAPGLTGAMRVAVTASQPGQVALAYLGTSNGQDYSGYITESLNVLARHPVFWSAAVNNPSAPLVNGSDPTTFGDRLLYATTVMTPDGAVWAGFHCAHTTACPGQRLGVVGSLTWKPAPHHR